MRKIIVDFNLSGNEKYWSKQSELKKIGFSLSKENTFVLEKHYLEFEDIKTCFDRLKIQFQKLSFQLRDDSSFTRTCVRTPGFLKSNFTRLAKLLQKDGEYFDVITTPINNKILNYTSNEGTKIHFITKEEKIKKDICDYRTGKPATVWDTLSHWAFDTTISYVIIDMMIENRRVVTIAKFIEE